MRLTQADHQVVLANLCEAERAASALSGLRMSRGELLASAYYGLCRAAMRRPLPDPFGRYAEVAARNQVIRDWRRLYSSLVGRRPVVSVDPEKLDLNEGRPAPSGIDPEDLAAFGAALDRLEAVDRFIVRKRLSGMSVVAIGKHLGWTRENTSRHLSQATRSLQRYLTCIQ
jgi:RNA polymerase sigma factor (sigma-70 family)